MDNKRATVTKDEASVTLTKAQLSRYEDLLKKRAISQQDYDTNKANYDQAVAQLAADQAAENTAQDNLDWTRVTAPDFAGPREFASSTSPWEISSMAAPALLALATPGGMSGVGQGSSPPSSPWIRCIAMCPSRSALF